MTTRTPMLPSPVGRSPAAAATILTLFLTLFLTLAALLPAGPVAAAIVNYSFANPSASGWTGGSLTIGSLDDRLSVLPALITGVIGGVTLSFVPASYYTPDDELWYDRHGPFESFDLYSSDFGLLTNTPTTTWRQILSTGGGTYANNSSGFYFADNGNDVGEYLPGDGQGTSVTFSNDVPVPAPLALLLAAVPALSLMRRWPRMGRPG